MIKRVFAQDGPIGSFTPPPAIARFGEWSVALVTFLNIILRLIFIGAGLFALWKFIDAGFSFINSGGDPKKLNEARDKILLTMVGLLVIAASFVIAAIAGVIIFGNPMAILQPELIGAPGP